VGENVGEGSSSVMEETSVYDERKKNSWPISFWIGSKNS
jgi:hypothetical protein